MLDAISDRCNFVHFADSVLCFYCSLHPLKTTNSLRSTADMRGSLEGRNSLAEVQALSPLNNKENESLALERYGPLKQSPIRQRPFIQQLKVNLEKGDRMQSEGSFKERSALFLRKQSYPTLDTAKSQETGSKGSDWLTSLDYEMERLLAGSLDLEEKDHMDQFKEPDETRPFHSNTSPVPKKVVISQLYKLKLLTVTTSRVPSREIEVSQSSTSNYGILLAQYNAMAKRLVEKNNEINLIYFKQSTLINDLIYYLNEQKLDNFGDWIESAKCSETEEKQQEENPQVIKIPEVIKKSEEVQEKPHTKIPLRIEEFPFKQSELKTDDTTFHYSKETIDHSSLLQLNLDEESTFDSTFHSN